MIGDLLEKIRKDKKVSKTDLAQMTNINIGHLSHIEKGERNPSHGTLKSICNALHVPYQPLFYTYDKNLTVEQREYNMPTHIKYDSLPVISSIESFKECPDNMQSASFILKVNNDDMGTKLKVGSFAYIEMNSPLNNKDIGLFEYEGKLIFRKFIVRKKDIVLRADKEGIADIIVTKDSPFYIIGKVLGSSDK